MRNILVDSPPGLFWKSAWTYRIYSIVDFFKLYTLVELYVLEYHFNVGDYILIIENKFGCVDWKTLEITANRKACKQR